MKEDLVYELKTKISSLQADPDLVDILEGIVLLIEEVKNESS